MKTNISSKQNVTLLAGNLSTAEGQAITQIRRGGSYGKTAPKGFNVEPRPFAQQGNDFFTLAASRDRKTYVLVKTNVKTGRDTFSRQFEVATARPARPPENILP
jgi:hypothetical protein